MWGIIPPPERIPEAIFLGAIGMIVSYLLAKWIYWLATRGM